MFSGLRSNHLWMFSGFPVSCVELTLVAPRSHVWWLDLWSYNKDGAGIPPSELNRVKPRVLLIQAAHQKQLNTLNKGSHNRRDSCLFLTSFHYFRHPGHVEAVHLQ